MIINQVVQGGGGSSVSEPYLEWSVVNGELKSTTSRIIDFTGVTQVSVNMSYAYYKNTAISGNVDMSSIVSSVTQSFQYMFAECPNITSVDLRSYVSPIKAFSYMFYKCIGLQSADLRSVTTIDYETTAEHMFDGCTSLATVRLDSLKKIGTSASGASNMFNNCTSLTSINLNSLEEITGVNSTSYMFQGCSALVDVNIDKLNKISNNSGMFAAFKGCVLLPTVRFCSLINLTGQSALLSCFEGCTAMQSVWFYALTTTSFGSRTNQFNNMLRGCTNVTVHFPLAIQSTIGSWSDVTGGFGGTNTTVLFDIVTSLVGDDTNTYTRSEKDSTSTATAWLYNDTLYYTSGVSNHTAGVNEPSVGDTIYSDDTCTTAVTTISSIA